MQKLKSFFRRLSPRPRNPIPSSERVTFMLINECWWMLSQGLIFMPNENNNRLKRLSTDSQVLPIVLKIQMQSNTKAGEDPRYAQPTSSRKCVSVKTSQNIGINSRNAQMNGLPAFAWQIQNVPAPAGRRRYRATQWVKLDACGSGMQPPAILALFVCSNTGCTVCSCCSHL